MTSRVRVIELNNLALPRTAGSNKGAANSRRRNGHTQAQKAPLVKAEPPSLLEMMRRLRSRPELGANPGAALLGVTRVNRHEGWSWKPFLVWLPNSRVRHLFVASSNGDGIKMLRTTLISISMQLKASELGLILIGDGFGPLVGLPHVRGNVLRDENSIRDVLKSLVRNIRYREPRGIHRPQFIVAVSELADVSQFESELTSIAENGPDVGIRLAVATKRPGDQWVAQFIKHFPFRLVGQVDLEKVGRDATGQSGTRAENQQRGEFTAAYNGKTTRFTAAHASKRELAEEVEALLHRNFSCLLPAGAPSDNGSNGRKRVTGLTIPELYFELAQFLWHKLRGDQ